MWGVPPVPHRPFTVKIVAIYRTAECLICGARLGNVDVAEDILLKCKKCGIENVCFAHEVSTK